MILIPPNSRELERGKLMQELDPTTHWAFPPSFFKKLYEVDIEMLERVSTPERQLVSDLISVINDFKGLSFIRGLLNLVDDIYQEKSADDSYVQERCALLCEQLADAKMHYGQKIITQEELIVDVRQAITCYRDAKRFKADVHELTSVREMGFGK